MSRKVLITGGAGFIGSHLADAYLAAGDRVWIVDDLSSGRRSNVPAAAEFVHMDIRDDRLGQVFADAGGFDVISHHAAQMDVRVSVADPRRDAAINIDGFLNVTECALRYGCGRFMFVSSGGVVYGEPECIPTPESAPKAPRSPYGVTKLAGEHYLHYYALERGLDYVAMRYGNVYGPRQDPHGEAGVVAIFSTRIAAGSALTIYGDGEQTRDYIFVRDVVSANLLLAETPLPPLHALDDRAFNVGTGTETSVVDLASALMRAAQAEVPVQHAEPRAGELRRSCIDTMKLRALGWSAAVPQQDGLAATYRHITATEAAA